MAIKVDYKGTSRSKLLFVCLTWWLPISSWSQTASPGIEREIKTVKPQDRWSTYTVDTVDLQSSERFGEITTTETMRNIAGVQVQSSGSLGEEATVRIRGTSDDQNLVLLDDVPLNSPFDSAFDFADFTLGNLRSLQVIKGSQSGYFGTSAMGGVVAMHSSSGAGKHHGEAFFQGGSFLTLREGMTVQGEAGALGYHLNYNRTDLGEDMGHDSYHNNNLGMRLDWQVVPPLKVSLISKFINSEKELPVDVTVTNTSPFTLSFVRDQNRQLQGQFLFNTIKLNAEVLPWYQPSLQIAHFNQQQDHGNPADTTGSQNPNIEFTDIELNRLFMRNNHNFIIYHGIKLGIELEADYEFTYDQLEVQTSAADPPQFATLLDTDRTIHAAILYPKVEFRDWRFRGGARYDHYSDFDGVISPQASVSYFYRPYATTVAGSYGKGFRAPAFRELASPVVGNPNLEPETVHTFELSAAKDFSAVGKIRFAYFANLFEDLIAIGSQAKFANVETAHSHGIEAESCFTSAPSINACVTYTYTDSELTDSSGAQNEIPLTVRHNLVGRLEFSPYGPLQIQIAANYRGESSIAGIPGVRFVKLDGTPLGTETEPTVKLDLQLFYRLYEVKTAWFSAMDLTFHGENLLNQEIEEFPGFPNSGINALAGIRLTLY